LAATIVASLPGTAQAQSALGSASGSATQRLADALHNLAQDPRYLPSLIDAGQASLALEDPDAAMGFFRRAEAISPSDGRIKAGMAAIMVRQGQPVEALRLFQQAEQAGESAHAYTADRALAYDLVGENALAQQDYRLALAAGPNPAVTRRLALSQAISGDQAGSEATLLPLLQQRDLAAYRTRAFALAILGKTDQAVSIAQEMLPAAISSRLAPYLRYMPRLTKSQQAAAAHLGRFPQAAEIGRETPALAAARPGPVSPRGGAGARLIPAGAPMGPGAASGAPEAAVPTPAAAPISTSPSAGQPATVALAAAPATSSPALMTAAQLAQGTGRTPPPAPAAPLAQTPPASLAMAPQASRVTGPPAGAEIASVPLPQAAAAPLSARAPVQVVDPTLVAVSETGPSPALASGGPPAANAFGPEPAPAPRDLALAFAEFAEPSPVTVSAQWAVDITSIEPKREAPKVEPKPEPPKAKAPPPKPVVPSRHWVQLGTGRDTGALAFDWRRVKRAAGGLLDQPKAHIAAWGQTNRLVAGPFANAKEANELVAKLKAKDVDSFRFTSARGEEVKPLD
jgi:Flp pilus assembly protein TadD